MSLFEKRKQTAAGWRGEGGGGEGITLYLEFTVDQSSLEISRGKNIAGEGGGRAGRGLGICEEPKGLVLKSSRKCYEKSGEGYDFGVSTILEGLYFRGEEGNNRVDVFGDFLREHAA